MGLLILFKRLLAFLGFVRRYDVTLITSKPLLQEDILAIKEACRYNLKSGGRIFGNCISWQMGEGYLTVLYLIYKSDIDILEKILKNNTNIGFEKLERGLRWFSGSKLYLE